MPLRSVTVSRLPSPSYLYFVACLSGSVTFIGRPCASRSIFVVNSDSLRACTFPRGLTVEVSWESSLYSQVRLSLSAGRFRPCGHRRRRIRISTRV